MSHLASESPVLSYFFNSPPQVIEQSLFLFKPLLLLFLLIKVLNLNSSSNAFLFYASRFRDFSEVDFIWHETWRRRRANGKEGV